MGFTIINGARLSTDANGNTVLVGADGVPLLTVEEPSGNIIANVNHRTGTLASLLTLDGGAGEISVATDTPAIVRHNGVPGGAKAFYLSGLIHSAFCKGNTTAVNPATTTQLAIDTVLLDPFSLVDVANDRLNVPRDNSLVYAQVTAIVSLSGLTGGTYRRAWLEVDQTAGGAWVACSGVTERPATTTDYLTVVGLVPPAAAGTETRVRVVAAHDDAVARSANIVNMSALVFKS